MCTPPSPSGYAADTAYSAATALADLTHLQASAPIFFAVYANAGDPIHSVASVPAGTAISTSLPSATDTTADWYTLHILAEGVLLRMPPRLARHLVSPLYRVPL
jgi:hypothetical protein